MSSNRVKDTKHRDTVNELIGGRVWDGDALVLLEVRGVSVREVSMVNRDDPTGAKISSSVCEIAIESVGVKVSQGMLTVWKPRPNVSEGEQSSYALLCSETGCPVGRGDLVLVMPDSIGWRNGMRDIKATAGNILNVSEHGS